MISIIGSHRQVDPLKRYTRLPLSSLHETIYFHNTKEILQNVRNLKDKETTTVSEEFDNTSLFLVEITSRRTISYEYELSDDDIETDILALRQELYPRPLVIISHICTYKNGERYELTCLLKKICMKYDIPFFNPTSLYDNFGSCILLHPLNTHYSLEGERLITQVYLYMINAILKTSYEPTFIHNFQVKELKK